MSTLTGEAGHAPAVAADDGDVLHIVGWWQDFLGRVAGVKVPRALCGERLDADMDRAGPTSQSPMCRRCEQINGPHLPVEYVRSYRLWW